MAFPDIVPPDWQYASTLGHYFRPMNTVEIFYSAVCSLGADIGKSHWTVTSCVSLELKSQDLITTARQAWLQLRYQQPEVASFLDQDVSQRIYRAGADTELEEWLLETFCVVPGTSAATLFSSMKSVKRPTLYVLPLENELVIRGPHSSLDGAGIILLWNDLLQAVEAPQTIKFGDEMKNLSPPLEKALGIPKPTEEDNNKAMQHLTTYGSSLPGIGLPTQPASRPGNTQMVQLKFSVEKSKAIISAAKQKGFTPTHIVHAAIIHATKLMSTVPGVTKYVSFGVFDYRPCCLPETDKYHANLYDFGWSLIVDHQDFHTTAGYLKEFYQSHKTDKERFPQIEPWGLALAKAFTQPPPPGIPPPSDPILSSLGLVDGRIRKQYGDIKVKDFWLAVDMVNTQIEVFLWTFDSQLTVSSCFNEEYYSKEDVSLFHELLEQILAKELPN